MCCRNFLVYCRALGILEGSIDVQAALLAPLRQMTALQVAVPARLPCKQCDNQHFTYRDTQALMIAALYAQADFDPATRARIEKGNEMMSISKRNFGFKMPKELIPV